MAEVMGDEMLFRGGIEVLQKLRAVFAACRARMEKGMQRFASSRRARLVGKAGTRILTVCPG